MLGLFISYHNDVAAGGTIVLVATGFFGLVWLFAPRHGLLATILARRRGGPAFRERREARVPDGR